MKLWTTPLATLAAVAVLIANAQAQDAPAPAQTDSTKAPAQATKGSDKKASAQKSTDKADNGKADASDAAPELPKLNSFSLYYNTWNSSHFTNGMRQNGTVPGGFGIADLTLVSPYSSAGYTWFDLKGNPGQEAAARLVEYVDPRLSLYLNGHQFSFFDPDFGTLRDSRDQEADVTADVAIAPSAGLYGTYKYEQRNLDFPAPLVAPNYTNRTYLVGGQKDFGGQTVGATLTETNYNDSNGLQPQTLTDRAQLRYDGNFGRLSAQGVIGSSRIEQQGQPDNWVRDYALSGFYDLSDTSFLGANVSQQVLDLRSIQNAYVRKRQNSGATFDTHLGAFGLDLNYNYKMEERVRADHSYVDTVGWNDYTVKFGGPIFKGVRLGLKGNIEDLTSAPTFLTNDPTLLYWQRKETLQLKLSGGTTSTSGYVSDTFNYRNNDARGIAINWNSFAIGGNKVLNNKLLAYAEFSSDQYDVRGNSPVAAQLGTYFPSSETISAGIDYTRSIHEGASLVWLTFYTQDEWGQQIALTYRRDLGKDNSFEITYSPWLQRDRLYDVDSFDARILTVKFGTRF